MRRYFVRHGGLVPQDVVELVSRDEEEVLFFPAGGGFQCRMPAASFAATHREVSNHEYSVPEAYPAIYDIDGMFGGIPGYSLGHRWNGWACPFFPKPSCDRLMAKIGSGAHHDPLTDSYCIPRDDEPGEFDTYPPRLISVEGQEIKVWGIGSGSWTWEEERADES